MQSICSTDTVDVEETLFPVEQTGIIQEIMVRRTKTAPTSKRKKAEKSSDIDRCNSVNSSKEDLSPVDEHTLKNIKGGMSFFQQF